MRLIGPNGEQVGVISHFRRTELLAKRTRSRRVRVLNAKPPVAKLIDQRKFKYNEKIAHVRHVVIRAPRKSEIRFRLKIDNHDFEVKKAMSRFLNGGDVAVTIMLRGEQSH